MKVEEGAPVSAFPITNEPVLGVNKVTDSVDEPAEELPVEVSAPVVVAPLISYMETEPVTVLANEAVIVSEPELPAMAYQM